MRHARWERLLAAYRGLNAANRAELEGHLQSCERCRALLQDHEVTDRLLANLQDPQPGERLRRRFEAALAGQAARSAEPRGLGRWASQAVAAGLVGLLSVGAWLAVYLWTHPNAAPWSRLGEAAAAPTATLSTPGPGVADLLAAAPAPWERVEVDAYYSGAGALHLRGGPRPPSDQVVCPDDWAAALTDRPFPATLQLLNSVHSNALPADGAWLVAVTPEAATPGVRTVAQLPYHARLRGHLGDPAFVHCANAERIFVVEEVVKVYEDQPPGGLQPAYPRRLPEGYASWPRHLEPTLGYSLPYPPDWQAQRLDGATVSFSAPAPPGYALVVRVHEGEVRYDQYDPASLPPLLQGSSMGVFEQGWSFDEPVEGSQRLTGYTVEREGAPDERSVSVLFAAHGRTYELSLRYPLGYAARQPLLTVLSAMVEGFRLDRLPPPSPTPPIRQELGPGPFLSVEEALERARRSQGVSLQLLHARLVSEAEARQVLGTGPCATFMGHPEGVWLLTVEGLLEGKARTMLLVLDAKTGQQLCGEEIDPAAGPLPGVTGPALTLTEGTRPGWQRLTSEEFAVSLELPANWEQVPGDPYRFVGSDGFLLLNAGMAPGSLDEVARQHADHKLKPFGSDPTFRALTVDGQEARLIVPSADQPAGEEGTELIVLYPRPVEIRGETYLQFILYADKAHIEELAATLEFIG